MEGRIEPSLLRYNNIVNMSIGGSRYNGLHSLVPNSISKSRFANEANCTGIRRYTAQYREGLSNRVRLSTLVHRFNKP